MSLRMISDVLKPRDVSTHCALCGRSFARFPSDEEHIFPKWLQRHHNLWTRRLNIPNFTGKRYDTVKLRICQRCNNRTFGAIETRLAPLLTSHDPFSSVDQLDDEELALWLGKIFWLLIRKSQAAIDFRTRDLPEPDRIIPNDIMPGTLYLGMIERAFAMKKGMVACYAGDPAIPRYFYDVPYSLYRFRIDERDKRFEAFDFFDNPITLGVGLRTGTLGVICLFDGGLHRRFLSQTWDFLGGHALHPIQFAEVAATMFYDGTVLHDDATRVTYFWNPELNAVVSQVHTRRNFNPYLADRHDPARLAAFIGRHTFSDPNKILMPDGHTFTSLHDKDRNFMRFAVTDEEVQAALADPDQIVLGPMDADWRSKPNSGDGG
ncbi:hypothetical protein QY049_20480 [Bradyrhizobium sp. WYCCWR 13022]|uniref:hypothetical protein n=1 Tax=unclassified Bradyrhizobium TaxID=2631580 RepID=UPI00263A998B|nr:hypothetical protein [Bradyrhizobium sp. WYCCWR 13022]MDN4985544.1 hypothetical protein [Bradyrhizobium sp. WYCCWR 13022]